MELLLFAGLIVVGVLIIRVGIKRSRQEGAGEGECQGRHRGTSTETERPSRSLPPITLDDPACPYCGAVQDYPPQRQRKGGSCRDGGETIHTRTAQIADPEEQPRPSPVAPSSLPAADRHPGHTGDSHSPRCGRARPRRLAIRRSTCLRGPCRRPSGSPAAAQAARQPPAPTRQGPRPSTPAVRSVPGGAGTRAHTYARACGVEISRKKIRERGRCPVQASIVRIGVDDPRCHNGARLWRK